MKLKKYIGENMHIALAKAKAELGENISIFESREVRDPRLENGQGIQITVGQLPGQETEPDKGSGLNSLAQRSPASASGAGPAAAADPRTDAYFNDYLSQALDSGQQQDESPSGGKGSSLETEVQILRQELLKLNSSLRRIVTGDFPAEFAKVFESLQNIGFSREDTEELTRHAFFRLESTRNPDFSQILGSMQGEIQSRFPVKGSLFLDSSARIFTFIGPTGSGKTTTLMKIAGNPSLIGNRKVGIISTDTYRLAGTEALKVFSKVASVPVIECRGEKDIPDALKQLRDRDMILIDTAGRSPYFPNYIQELQNLVGSGKANKTILTLSATSDPDDLYLAAGLYSVLNPMGIIFTKLDETGRPGKIYSMVKHLGIPPLFFTQGQAVPQDISPADGAQFWKLLSDCII